MLYAGVSTVAAVGFTRRRWCCWLRLSTCRALLQEKLFCVASTHRFLPACHWLAVHSTLSMLSSLQKVYFAWIGCKCSQVFVSLSTRNALLSLSYNNASEMHASSPCAGKRKKNASNKAVTSVVGGGVIMIDIDKRRRSQRLVRAVQMRMQLREVGHIRHVICVVLRVASSHCSSSVGVA